jgi:hypothetical protein
LVPFKLHRVLAALQPKSQIQTTAAGALLVRWRRRRREAVGVFGLVCAAVRVDAGDSGQPRSSPLIAGCPCAVRCGNLWGAGLALRFSGCWRKGWAFIW